MHISDGVLSVAVVAATYAGAAGLTGYALKGIEAEEIPKISLMTGVFFVGSAIRIPFGPTSLHLMLTGFIGLVAGRRATISILIALMLQLFLLQFGGLSSLGANVFMTAFPAVLLGKLLVPLLRKHGKHALAIGTAAGGLAVIGTVLLLSLILTQANLRFGVGPFSTIRILSAAHVPLMIAEAIVTGFAVQIIMKIRPEYLCGAHQQNQEGADLNEND